MDGSGLSSLTESFPSLATNAGVFMGLLALAWGGYRSVNKSKLEKERSQTDIIGASLQDNMTLMMHTEALRAQTQQMAENGTTMRQLKDCIETLSDNLRDNTRELRRNNDH